MEKEKEGVRKAQKKAARNDKVETSDSENEGKEDAINPILDTLKPSVIIVYQPDITFVREIEVYKSENLSNNLKVYFLSYEDSTEVQNFEASIRRENAAFESLIRQKSMIVIPVDQVWLL